MRQLRLLGGNMIIAERVGVVMGSLGLNEHRTSFGLVYPQSNNYLLDRMMMVLASIYRVSIGSQHTHAPVKQPIRLFVSVRAYQSVNNVFLLQQISISRGYQFRN